MSDIAHLRKSYEKAELDESASKADPMEQFDLWFRQALDGKLPEPNAMTLATVGPDGRPSTRVVLIKAYDSRGLVFYTNYESRKGRDLAANPRAALLFHWDALGRQVRVAGPVERLGEDESDGYFATRPPGAQAAARGSRQGTTVSSREELEEAARRAGPGDRPDWWGGYVLRPQGYEFWQHREDRLHDRLRYEPDGPGWRIVRLAP